MGCKLKGGGGLYARMSVGAVLLAAGESRRMAGVNKLLLEINGVPLVKRTLFALSGSGIDELVIVLGHEADRVEPLLADFPVRIVRNPDPAAGQMASVRAGLEALAGDFDAVVIALADQPLLNAQDVTALIGAFKKRERGAVVVPTFEGARGNPIILAGDLRKRILESDVNLGCRNLIDSHPELVTTFPAANDHYTFDVDTREDLERLEARLRRPIPDWREAQAARAGAAATAAES
jgi:CTP:molybdopterin cytidylyltransferase MocA